MATSSTLVSFDGNVWKEYNAIPLGVPSLHATNIHVDDNNIKWFGTTKGLVKYDNTTLSFYEKANGGLPHNEVIKISSSANNVTWVSTLAGLSSFDGTTWKTFTTSNSGLNSPRIFAILCYLPLSHILSPSSVFGGLCREY